MSTSPALHSFLRSGPGALGRSLGESALRAAIGNAPTTLEGQVTPTDEEVQAQIDLFDEGDELLAIADLPSASFSDVDVYAYPSRLAIHLRHIGRRCVYRLPAPIKPGSMRCALRNGLLEIRVDKALA
jgi:HSP20 family molecular chaperone IbpA